VQEAGAHHARGDHIGLAHDDPGLGRDHPGDAGPAEHADDQGEQERAGRLEGEQGAERDREDEEGEAQGDVGGEVHELRHHPADGPGDHAEDHADERGEHGRGDAHQEGDAGSVDHEREEVPAGAGLHAEPVLGADTAERPLRRGVGAQRLGMVREGVVAAERRELRGEDGGEQARGHEDRGGERHGAQERTPDAGPCGALLDRDGRFHRKGIACRHYQSFRRSKLERLRVSHPRAVLPTQMTQCHIAVASRR